MVRGPTCHLPWLCLAWFRLGPPKATDEGQRLDPHAQQSRVIRCCETDNLQEFLRISSILF